MNLLGRVSVFINRYALWIILAYIALAAVSLDYAVNNIGINSNTAEMFDPELDFRERQNFFNETFSILDDNLVVVVEGQTPELTDIVINDLYNAFEEDDGYFSDVYLPGGGDYFQKNQFLFLNEEELEKVSDRLSRSNVFLSLLAQNHSMRGLFTLTEMILVQGSEQQVNQLNGLFGQMSQAIDSRLADEEYAVSWQQAFGGNELSDQAGIRFLQVKPVQDSTLIFPAKPGYDRSREIISSYSDDERVSVRTTGKMAMSFEEIQSVTEGAVNASILALIFVTIILWIGLRSVRVIASSIITLFVGLIFTLCFCAWAIGQLNMISVAFAVLYIGLGIDYAIHFTLKYTELTDHHQSAENALFFGFKEVGPALLLTCISTMIGFYAFIPTDFDGVSELGLIAGTGMLISFIVTFTLLPALLKIFRIESRKISKATLKAPFAKQITSLLASRNRLFRYSGIVAGIVAIFVAVQIEFDYDPISLRDDKSESVSTLMDLIGEGRMNPWNIEILTYDPDSVQYYKDLLAPNDMTGRVLSFLSFIPENQEEKMPFIRRINSRISRIPEITKDSASFSVENQILAARDLKNQIESYERSRPENLDQLQSSLSVLINELEPASEVEKENITNRVEAGLLQHFPALLNNLRVASSADFTGADDVPEELKKRWISESGIYRIQVSPPDDVSDSNSLRSFDEEVRQIVPLATGELVTFIESGNIVAKAFIQAMFYSLVAIILLLLIYLRSTRDTLNILLPLILTAMLTGAAMVIFGLKFNFANIIAIPMLLGLGVDNAIHMVHRARDVSIANSDLLKTTTSRAIFFSSLTTLFSFGNLIVSPHNGTASLGLVLLFGVLFLIFSTLIVLPAFLIGKSKNKVS